MGAMATTSTLTSIFRSHVDSEWDPHAEPEIDHLSTIVLDALPIRPPLVPWYGPDLSVEVGSELDRPVPFAYRFAEPAVYPDPDPNMVPRLSTHDNIWLTTICGGRRWRDLRYSSD